MLKPFTRSPPVTERRLLVQHFRFAFATISEVDVMFHPFAGYCRSLRPGPPLLCGVARGDRGINRPGARAGRHGVSQTGSDKPVDLFNR